MDDLAAHAALGLTLRIGETMLTFGASAADVTATALRVAVRRVDRLPRRPGRQPGAGSPQVARPSGNPSTSDQGNLR
jgi:hypothetical protein